MAKLATIIIRVNIAIIKKMVSQVTVVISTFATNINPSNAYKGFFYPKHKDAKNFENPQMLVFI